MPSDTREIPSQPWQRVSSALRETLKRSAFQSPLPLPRATGNFMAKLPSRLLRRCEQPGEGVLSRSRFPPPGPARRSPRSPPAAGAAAGRPPPSQRRRHGAAAGSGPFPAAAHRHGSPGPGSLPPPSPKRRGWSLPPAPGCPRACAPPSARPIAERVPSAARFLNGEPSSCGSLPCAAGKAE